MLLVHHSSGLSQTARRGGLRGMRWCVPLNTVRWAIAQGGVSCLVLSMERRCIHSTAHVFITATRWVSSSCR